jgi:hypothetical protein
MFLHLKRFLRGRSFGSDDEVITTVEDYLKVTLVQSFSFDGINSLGDRWQRVVANEGQYI